MDEINSLLSGKPDMRKLWTKLRSLILRKTQQRLRFRAILWEQLEDRRVMTIDGWTNVLQPLSVLNRPAQQISPLDALNVINEINSRKYSDAQGRLPATPPTNERPPYFDVNCNGFVEPLDALLLINYLNGGLKPNGWQPTDVDSQNGAGFVTNASCSPRLIEGNSLRTTLTSTIVLPDDTSAVRVLFENPAFDTASLNSIRDAFEIVVTDANGDPLVLPYAPRLEATYNVSESIASAYGPSLIPGTVLQTPSATINLTGLAAGTRVNVAVRLLNNDLDTTSSVILRGIEVIDSIGPNPSSSVWNAAIASPIPAAPINWSRMEDLTGNYTARYGRTTYTNDRQSLITELSIENRGSTVATGTMVAVIESLSDLNVSVVAPDGWTPDGRPYLLVSNGSDNALSSGEVSASREFRFSNPLGKQFTFEVKVLGLLHNQPPAFTATPLTLIQAGNLYLYQAIAKSPVDARVSYSVESAPSGMTIDGTTGYLRWPTRPTDVGLQSVVLKATDEFGLYARQSFSIDVRASLVNRPPIITSTPETDAVVTSPYEVLTFATGDTPTAVATIKQSNGQMSIVTANTGEQQLGYLGPDGSRWSNTEPISIGEPKPAIHQTAFVTGYPVELKLVPNSYNENLRDIQDVIAEDVDGDGVPDLITAASLNGISWTQPSETGHIVVNLGNRDGTFRFGWTVQLPASTMASQRAASMHYADVTGDGLKDIIVTSQASKQTLVYPANSNSRRQGGTDLFNTTPIVSANTINYIGNAQIGDINGDGQLDLVYFENSPFGNSRNGFSVQLGDGTGRFAESVFVAAANGNGTNGYLADVDGRNGLDIVRLNYSDTRAEVFLNSGSGFFGSVIYSTTKSFYTPNSDFGRNINLTSAYMADYDGDGRIDLLGSGPNGVSLFKGQGDGRFGDGTKAGAPVIVNGNFRSPAWPGLVNSDGQPIDFNRDGKLDFVFGGTNNEPQLMIGLANGDGTFDVQQYNPFFPDDIGHGNVHSPRTSALVSMADFNQDGILDVAVGGNQISNQPGSVGVILGDRPGRLRAPSFVMNYEFDTNYSAAKGDSGRLVAGDFDGDGVEDIVASGGVGFGTGYFFAKGRGDGSFEDYRLALTGVSSDLGLTALDIDKDGKLDLAWFDGNAVAWAFGLGNGIFQMQRVPINDGGPAFIANDIAQTDDFNFDGYPDLVFRLQTGNIDTNFTTRLIVMVYNPNSRRYERLADADNLFTSTPRRGGFYFDESVGLGDLNNDGTNEFFTFSASIPNSTLPARLDIYESVGGVASDASQLFRKTTIVNPLHFPNGQGAGFEGQLFSYVVDDFNHDGKNDLAFVSSGAVTSVLFGNGDFTFRDPVVYRTNGRHLSKGDFNGDGITDLVSTWGYGFINQSDKALNNVLLGNRHGSFSEPLGFTMSTGQSNGFVIGDFNGDGVDDITGLGGSRHNEVLLGKPVGLTDIATGDVNGDGAIDTVAVSGGLSRVKVSHGVADERFARQDDLFSDLFPVAVDLVDADNDQLLDILTANHVGKSISLFKHTTPTTYDRTDIDLPLQPTQMALGDLDGDGKQDIIVISSVDESLVALRGANGTFGMTLSLPLGFAPSGIALGDVSGDGKLDAVLTDADNNRIVILNGRGDGTFAAPFAVLGVNQPGAIDLPLTWGSNPIALADMNSDGKLDIAVTEPNQDKVAVLLNRGNGRYTTAQQIGVGDYPMSIRARDMNNDGRTDLLVSNRDDDTLTVILNRFDPNNLYTYQPTAIDPDGDDVSFELTSAPGGMLYDAASNTLLWAPMPEQLGDNSVVFTASDGKGGSTDQGFTIRVSAPVSVIPPNFTSTPVVSFAADEVYAYQPNVQAADKGPKRFSLVTAPAGMTIDPTTGAIEWDARSNGIQLFDEFKDVGSTSIRNYGQISIPDSASLRPESVTVEGWFNFADPRGAVWDQLLTKMLSTSNSGVHSFGLEYYYGTIRARIGKVGETQSLAIVTAPTPVEFGKWTHVAMSFDNASKRLALFIDGKNVGSANSLDGIGYNESPFYSGNMIATLSRIRVWNTARSEGDIARDMLVDLPSDAPGLVLHLEFNDPDQSTTIADSSPLGNNGRLVGEPDFYHFPQRVPSLASLDDYPVTIRVDDGRGGIAEQSFTVSTRLPFDSRVSGVVYDDRNGDGVRARNAFANLVLNGDFSAGVSGVDTDFNLRLNPGQFSWLGDTQATIEANSPALPLTGNVLGHTYGDNNDSVLLVNGDTQTRAAWRQSIATIEGQAYEFSYWILRPTSYEAARIATRVDGTQNGNSIDLASIGAGTWTRFFGTFTASSPTTTLEIVSLGSTVSPVQGLGGVENSFAIDDIMLVPSNAPRRIVSGDANPYLAGMPNGSTAFGSTAPQSSPPSVPVIAGQQLQIEATGSVRANGFIAARSPDGTVYDTNTGLLTPSALNGISQYKGPTHGALIGVFLDDIPPAGTAPDALDFRTNGNVTGGINYAFLSPQLRQVFFIGDGKTSEGVRQSITVPLGATRLFLAAASSSSWQSNRGLGDFEVLVHSSLGFQPEVGQSNRTVFIDSNFNGRFDPKEPSTTTNSDGVYSITVPGVTAPVGLVPKSGQLQTTPSIATQIFDTRVDRLPLNFGSQASESIANPRFSSSPVTSAIAPGAYVYQAYAQSPAGSSIEYSLAVGPQGMSIDVTSGLVRWNPTAANTGENEVILKGTASDGKFALQRFTIAVRVNTAPIFTSSPPSGAYVGVPIEYQVLAQDAEQSTLTYSLNEGSEAHGHTIDPLTGLISWTPSTIGLQSVVVRVSDNFGASTEQNFNWNVVAATSNREPQFDPISDAAIVVGRSFGILLHAIDPDHEPIEYSLVDGPAGLVVQSDGRLVFTPQETGSFTVTVAATDSRGGRTEETFVLTSASRATPSRLQFESTPSTAAIVGQPYAYDVVGQGAYSFELTTRPTGMSIDPLRGTIRWMPTKDQLGVQTVRIRASDVLGNVVEQSFVIAVRSSSLVPTISSAPPTEAAVGSTYVYPVQVANPSRSPVIYTLTAAPSGMAIDANSGAISWTPTTGQEGPAIVSIGVRDALGNFSTQTYSIMVAAGIANQAPSITSIPSIDAAVGSIYRYNVVANDPEGSILTYGLRQVPTGFAIDPSTGSVTWVPSSSDIGTVTAIITATDPLGGTAVQSLAIDVRPANLAPVIRSNPTLKVAQGALYRYDVLATDPNREALFYALDSAPSGMAIDSFGRIRWQTELSTPLGTHNVTVRVTDPFGAQTTQSHTMAVVADTLAPRVTILVAGEPVLYPWSTGYAVARVVAADDVAVSEIDFKVDGQSVALAADGTARIYFSQPGKGRLTATAKDPAGNVGTALARVSMRSGEEDGSGNPAPESAITSVGDGAQVRGLVDVIGTAVAPDFEHYVLSYRRIDESTYRTILTSTTPVANGSLGKWDTTLLENDNYVIKLEVYDTFGSFAGVEVEVSVTGELKLGNFRLSFEDLTIPVAGIPITIARTYDTLRSDREGDFGYGWRMEYRNTDLRTNLPKSGLEDVGIFAPFTPNTRVFITLPGGEREGFTFTPEIKVLPGFGQNNNLVLASPRFTPDRGITSTLSAGSGQLTVSEFGELYAAGGIPWNPASSDFGGYTLTTREGIQYKIDGATGLMTSAIDRNGNVLTFGEDGVTSQTENLRVAIDRDAKGRIRSITDSLGKKVSYEYSAAGDLAKVVDRVGNTTTMSYRTDRAHYLDTIVDPLGRAGIRNEYDANNRLKAIVNADGKRIETTYDPNNRLETITDPLGNVTISEYDLQGNVVRKTDALGAVTRTEYDDNNYPTKFIDALGRETTMVNDSRGFKLSETDARGNTTRYTYSFFGDETSMTDAVGNVTRTDFDTKGNLIRRTNANGQSSAVQYSRSGLLESFTALDGVSTTVTNEGSNPGTFTTDGRRPIDIDYDSAGRAIAMRFLSNATNAETEVLVQRQLDANGRTVRETDGQGGVTQSFYDAGGNRIRFIDQLGRTTRYEYDFADRLLKTIYPDNTEERIAYDAAGRKISTTNRLGRTTHYQFDAVGRQIAMIHPDNTPNDLSDNPTTRTEYDLAGQVTKRTDELGQATTYQYDAAGNEIARTNSLGKTWTMAYDAANRQISSLDPLGNIARSIYDGVSNVVEAIAPDGSRVLSQYDGQRRLTARVDAEGGRTEFRYDAYGALIEVIDPLGNRTRYERNERGQATAMIDAGGRRTEFEFDHAGRQISRTLPDGSIERMTYDAAGQMTSTVDFMGRTTTYTYDVNGRQIRQQFADGRINETAYNAIGQATSSREGTSVTQYTYDVRDRLTQKTDPDGQVVQYTYDVASNLLSTSSIAGITTYTYDAVNQLLSVTAGSEVTRYVYDDAGRKTEIQNSNGTIERREYDANSRVVRQTLMGPSGTLDDTRTTYDRVGRKLSLTESTGRRETFTYDLAGRLIANSVDEVTGVDRNTTWLYDAVGNRLRRDDSVSGVTTYQYDNRDRLMTEIANVLSLNPITTNYLYDANGNVLSQFDGTKRIENTWDAANRLIESKVTEGASVKAVRYTYSPDGERYERIEDSETTRFLVDSNREHSVVIAEIVNGVVRVRYARPPAGEAAIAVVRDGQISTIYTTPMGTTKLVSNAAGIVTDRITVDPFGVVLARTGTTVGLPIYNGEFRDALTGYDYLRARFYSPEMGRFASMDTFAGWQDMPISMNKYAYAHSDPVNWRDPSGMFGVKELAITSSIQATISAGLTLVFTRSVKSAVEEFRRSFVLTFLTFGILRAVFAIPAITVATQAAQRTYFVRTLLGTLKTLETNVFTDFGNLIARQSGSTFALRMEQALLNSPRQVRNAIEGLRSTLYALSDAEWRNTIALMERYASEQLSSSSYGTLISHTINFGLPELRVVIDFLKVLRPL